MLQSIPFALHRLPDVLVPASTSPKQWRELLFFELRGVPRVLQQQMPFLWALIVERRTQTLLSWITHVQYFETAYNECNVYLPLQHGSKLRMNGLLKRLSCDRATEPLHAH